jgi:hypothetical protein
VSGHPIGFETSASMTEIFLIDALNEVCMKSSLIQPFDEADASIPEVKSPSKSQSDTQSNSHI